MRRIYNAVASARRSGHRMQSYGINIGAGVRVGVGTGVSVAGKSLQIFSNIA